MLIPISSSMYGPMKRVQTVAALIDDRDTRRTKIDSRGDLQRLNSNKSFAFRVGKSVRISNFPSLKRRSVSFCKSLEFCKNVQSNPHHLSLRRQQSDFTFQVSKDQERTPCGINCSCHGHDSAAASEGFTSRSSVYDEHMNHHETLLDEPMSLLQALTQYSCNGKRKSAKNLSTSMLRRTVSVKRSLYMKKSSSLRGRVRRLVQRCVASISSDEYKSKRLQ